MIGLRFGLLTVTSHSGRDRHGKPLWRCRCKCGRIVVVRGEDLRAGRQKTCGRSCKNSHVDRKSRSDAWTDAEVALLGHASDRDVAEKTGRTHAAVETKRRKLGITPHRDRVKNCPDCGAQYRSKKARCRQCALRRRAAALRKLRARQAVNQAKQILEPLNDD